MKTKKVMEKLEKIIKTASVIYDAHESPLEKGEYYSTYSEKKDKRKGYILHKMPLIENKYSGADYHYSMNVGTKMEFTQFYPRGDIETYSIRITMGGDNLEWSDAKFKMKDHTLIEAWMEMRDKEIGTLYGAYSMETIVEALEYKTDNKLEKKFFKLLGENIYNTVKADEALFVRKFGK